MPACLLSIDSQNTSPRYHIYLSIILYTYIPIFIHNIPHHPHLTPDPSSVILPNILDPSLARPSTINSRTKHPSAHLPSSALSCRMRYDPLKDSLAQQSASSPSGLHRSPSSDLEPSGSGPREGSRRMSVSSLLNDSMSPSPSSYPSHSASVDQYSPPWRPSSSSSTSSNSSSTISAAPFGAIHGYGQRYQETEPALVPDRRVSDSVSLGVEATEMASSRPRSSGSGSSSSLGLGSSSGSRLVQGRTSSQGASDDGWMGGRQPQDRQGKGAEEGEAVEAASNASPAISGLVPNDQHPSPFPPTPQLQLSHSSEPIYKQPSLPPRPLSRSSTLTTPGASSTSSESWNSFPFPQRTTPSHHPLPPPASSVAMSHSPALSSSSRSSASSYSSHHEQQSSPTYNTYPNLPSEPFVPPKPIRLTYNPTRKTPARSVQIPLSADEYTYLRSNPASGSKNPLRGKVLGRKSREPAMSSYHPPSASYLSSGNAASHHSGNNPSFSSQKRPYDGGQDGGQGYGDRRRKLDDGNSSMRTGDVSRVAQHCKCKRPCVEHLLLSISTESKSCYLGTDCLLSRVFVFSVRM